MNITVQRLKDDGKTTIGMLAVDEEFECFTVEDTYHEVKVHGETCIPKGTYEIKLRDAGGMTKKYAKRYDFHRGMLWLQDVPGYKWVYIHTGNTARHTEGCILVNTGCDTTDGRMYGMKSRPSYAKLYVKILEAIDRGESVTITIE